MLHIPVLNVCGRSVGHGRTSYVKLSTFEMCLYQQIRRLSQTDHINNEEILRRIGKQQKITFTVKKIVWAFDEHILQSRNSSLKKMWMAVGVQGDQETRRFKACFSGLACHLKSSLDEALKKHEQFCQQPTPWIRYQKNNKTFICRKAIQDYSIPLLTIFLIQNTIT